MALRKFLILRSCMSTNSAIRKKPIGCNHITIIATIKAILDGARVAERRRAAHPEAAE
jgi:hypothetical protein